MAISNKNKNRTGKSDDVVEVVEKIMTYEEPYRSIGLTLHNLIMDEVSQIQPRVWYGMPGYARAGSKPVLLFFRHDADYMTIGYTEKVAFQLDDGSEHRLMPCAWFFKELDDATKRKIVDIVRKAFRD